MKGKTQRLPFAGPETVVQFSELEVGHGEHEHSSAIVVVFSDVGKVVVDAKRGKAIEVVDKSFKLHPPSIRSKIIHLFKLYLKNKIPSMSVEALQGSLHVFVPWL